MTNTGEKPYIPEFGGNVNASLFENFTPITVVTLKGRLETAIRNFEPRANLLKVEVIDRIDSNELIVSIVFNLMTKVAHGDAVQ